MTKLREEDLVCAQVLTAEGGRSVRSTAQELGVAESTLRYRLKRRAEGAADGRRHKPEACAAHDGVIQAWLQSQQQRLAEGQRPEPVRALYDTLVGEHGYQGTYKAVARYVRRRRRPPKVRPLRRVEVRPGSQAQVDWVEPWVHVRELGGRTRLNAFSLSLSFSRMWSVQWRLDQGQLSWQEAHNHAFEAVQGVPWSVRFDNCKTAVARRGGPWAILNDDYAAYARQLGFVPDACRIRRPTDKGKVERRVRDVRWNLIRRNERFETLADLQTTSDRRVRESAERLRCPLTGQSVAESWQLERPHLAPLPKTLPTPFDTQVQRPVGRDGLVRFDGREYGVPFACVGRAVQVRGCAATVEIYVEDTCVMSYPRHTACRLLIDQRCYEGAPPDHLEAPTPLGRIGQRIVLPKSWDWQAPTRPLDGYAALVERAGRRR